jgi:sodium/hydrogen antiporter
LLGRLLDHVTWSMLLYAVLSLTVMRIAPVFLSLLGTGMSAGTKLFIGWFGPRGLASIVFAIIVFACLAKKRSPLRRPARCCSASSRMARRRTP